MKWKMEKCTVILERQESQMYNVDIIDHEIFGPCKI